MKDINIPVTVGGVTFKNPFFVASGPTTKSVRQLKRIEETGWAAASIKLSIDPAPYINRKPRYALFPQYNALAFTAEKRLTFNEGLKLVEEGKKQLSDLLLMANITYAGDNGIPGWVNMAKGFRDAGADIIELNMCCPNMSYNVELTSGGSKNAACQTGASLGQNADIVSQIVRAIKAEVDIPLFVKLTPEGGHIANVARALYEAGADAVGTTANRLGIPPVNIDAPEKSAYHLQQEISMSCYCGEWLKPLAQRDVYEIRKVCGMEPVVTGAGGVRNWHDAVELMLCGANLVGVCSETLISGYDIVRPMIRGLKDYMDSHGYSKADELVGRIVPEVKTAPEVTLFGGAAHIKDQPLYAPCKSACPLNVPVQGYVQSVAKGDFKRAYELICSKGPMQSICQFLCEHPCEKACVRGRADSPVAIREIKRFVLDYAQSNGLKPDWDKAQDIGKRIAVIGSGPAGISGAYELAKAGYAVTVFDKESVPGGSMLRMEDRALPRDAIGGLIQALSDMGIEFVVNTVYGSDITPNSLFEQGYCAVLLATGKQKRKSPSVPNGDMLVDSVEFIEQNDALLGKNCVIYGNSIEAVIAARMAVRKGANSVVLACNKPIADISQAKIEGVKVLDGVLLHRVEVADDRICGLELTQKSLDGAVIKINCDVAVADYICTVEEHVMTGLNAKDEPAYTAAKEENLAEKIFCAGAVAGCSSFINTVSSGVKAAAAIDALLRGESASIRLDSGYATVKAADVLKRNGYIQPERSMAEALVHESGKAQSKGYFTRVFTEKEAINEAARCLNCGCSEGCQLCKTICTDFAPYVASCDRMAIDPKECVACGMCYNRCPNHNIEMICTGETV